MRLRVTARRSLRAWALRHAAPCSLVWLLALAPAYAQPAPPPEIVAGSLKPGHAIDGRLDEADWGGAMAIDAFRQADPREGEPATGRTTVRVVAGPKALVIGIVCEQPPGVRPVSFSVRRDAPLTQEDHVRLVLGPFMDGRSGYVFAVNPSGARYDGLVNPGGENDNPEWDGIWDAATTRQDGGGWTAEVWIPFLTLNFKPGLHAWHFNVQRRIQGALETDRWASAARQYQVTQTSRAGVLTGLPDIDLGRGVSIRPALRGSTGVPAPSAAVDNDVKASLDVTQRLGPNVLASGTVNTDFAETEVDTRRTNLTRFPLFFPEKRTFFLEGDDIFAFGLGLNQDVLPYFSRRIGLVNGNEVPIIAGGKVNGRIGNTNFGGLTVATNDRRGVVDDEAVMGVVRVKQNLWRESWVGGIATVGDPLAASGRWLAGGDFTYATSRLRGTRNFLAGVWALATDRHAGSDATAAGFKLDYPNDKWDIQFTYKRIGRDFVPAVGFVPRPAVQIWNAGIDNRTRVATGPLQQLLHEFRPFVATNLEGKWESYRVFMAPVNWRFRSGDRFEFNVNPTGERLVAPFQISPGVVLAPGSYHWLQYRLEVGTAQKRRLYTQLTWWFGGFYDGTIDQIVWTGAWNPTPLVTVEFTGERNMPRLPAGDFNQTLIGNRLRLNLSPDLSIASYLQYDTISDSVGVNTRLRWTFRPEADLFVVYNHNVRSIVDRWQLESNQLVVKAQYAWRR